MSWEKITPGTTAALFCPKGTIYSFSQKNSAVDPFSKIYYRVVDGFGPAIQVAISNNMVWTREQERKQRKPKDIWWVDHQSNSIYLTTDEQFTYCQLIFGSETSFQEIG